MSSSKSKLSKEDLEPSQGKGRVTMYVDLDVLKAVREAKSLKLGYQTYINQILREYFINESSDGKKVTTEDLLLELEALKKDVSQLKKKASGMK